MIHVRNLRKSYADLRRGQFVALNGLTFDALSGQIFGLLGPNGAGKTTALRILSTVLKMRNAVVLPAPFGPKSPKIWPDKASNVSPLSATN